MACPTANTDEHALGIRIHGQAHQPTLIHLPGLHGDWTLLGPFRLALAGRARLVEFTYPSGNEWSLQNYADAVQTALSRRGIVRGWLLGESFSSQIAWHLSAPHKHQPKAVFRPEGLILVGGFVRHPWPMGVRLAHATSSAVPLWLLRTLCRLYVRRAGRHYGDRPEVTSEFAAFVERRAARADRVAMTWRYRLICNNDLRPLVRSVQLPVHHLSGAWDPIVPWWQVRPWLRRHCPGYRGSRIIRRAGHNVLLSAPQESAEQILNWIQAAASEQTRGREPIPASSRFPKAD
jgi:pimeloyl-ACP methyl ester carboxylesterase